MRVALENRRKSIYINNLGRAGRGGVDVSPLVVRIYGESSSFPGSGRGYINSMVNVIPIATHDTIIIISIILISVLFMFAPEIKKPHA